MRRVLTMVLLLAVGSLSAPRAAAAAPARAVCEGYCAIVGGGCYVFLGIFIGKDKCEAAYNGCIDGCIAGLADGEM